MARLILAISLFLLVACDGEEKNQTTNAPAGTTSLGGDVVLGLSSQTLVHDGLIREFLLYVPTAYDGARKLPLVLNFHGNGGTPEAHMAYSDMRDFAELEEFIVIYPQGTLLDGDSHWNSMVSADGNKSDADDLGFVNALLMLMSSNYALDESRVYATGYSNGADFTYTLACYLSERITGIAPVSGLMTELSLQPCTPAHPTAVMIFNGTADYVRPYGGYDGYLESVDDAANFWVGYNNAGSSPEVTNINNSGLRVERSHYGNGDGGVGVSVFKVLGGDHIWFDFDVEGV